MLKKRTSEILSEIIKSKNPITVKQLSDIFDVSERTIRYDLDEIDYFLKEKNLPKLIRKPNSGIEFDSGVYDNILKFLNSPVGLDDYILSSGERQKIILCEFLKRKDFITINELAEVVCASRSTVVNDLKKVKSTIKHNGLELISIPNYGLKLEGDEKKIRHLAIQMLISSLDDDSELSIEKSSIEEKNEITLDSHINKILGDIDLNYIEECIRVAEKSLNVVFSDVAFSSIVIHIAMAIKRLQLGKDIFMPEEELKMIEFTPEMAVAANVAKMVEDYFNVEIPVYEIGYIAIHFLGSSVTLETDVENKNYMELQILLNSIIDKLSNKLQIDLHQEEHLFEGLIKHLRPLIYRLKHNLDIKNPVIDQIKKDYYELFNLVKEALGVLESYTHNSLSDEEIGYVTMHFAAALERIKKNSAAVKNVLIVCSTGIGTAKLLASRVLSVFNANIIDTISLHQIDKYADNDKVELIISTIPIKNSKVKYIRVNPLLKEEDIEVLQKYLKRSNGPIQKPIEQQNQTESKRFFEGIMDTIQKYCQVLDYEKLYGELKEKLDNLSNKGDKKREITLTELLVDTTISLDVCADNWEDAVRKAGEILCKNGLVERRYIECMVDEIKNIGPYIVIGDGIALPHSRIQNGVKKVGMSFIRLKTPVNFGSKDKDPVDLIFAMCSTDKTSHRYALSQLGKILDDDEIVNILRTKDKIEILQALKDTLQN